MTPDVKAKESAMDFSLFYTIMYYVVLIILGPITTFFVSKIVVFEGKGFANNCILWIKSSCIF